MVPYGSIKENRRVLLVENIHTDRLLLRTWLMADRIEVYDAVDIITGLAACSRFQPNLILLQIRLPTWDGYEVIRRLKDDPRTLSIPVIFLATSATTAEKARGIDMGAVDFISKPIDPVELLARVHSALRTKAYLDLLEQRAHIDGLTELSNRFALEHRLPQEWDSCQQRDQSLAILIIDLDHFKRINDRYGHAAGDEVLRQMALTLRNSFRVGDFLARYGGEEFVVVAPDCDLEGAIRLAEAFRVTVTALRVEFRTSTIMLTASIGIAMAFDSGHAKPIDAFEQADQALYQAKGAGRNAVWIWDQCRRAPIARETWLAEDSAHSPSDTGDDRDEPPSESDHAVTILCPAGMSPAADLEGNRGRTIALPDRPAPGA
jgi:diguanylate cyclase (GGDEF)-like protein